MEFTSTSLLTDRLVGDDDSGAVGLRPRLTLLDETALCGSLAAEVDPLMVGPRVLK